MKWNYCPECSHRVYKHNAQGCEDGACDKVVECPGAPECDSTGKHVHKQWSPCDCEVKHAELVMT